MNRSVVGAVAGAATLLLVLSGCSSSSPDASEEEQSPLSAYLSAAWGGDLSEEEQTERFERENTQREELLAECMTEQGFEYIPATNNGSISFGSDVEWEPESREWVSQYGYGMVKWPGADDQASAPTEEYIDPNQDYVASLSESEQTAYYEALSGPPIPEDQMSEDGSYEYDWEQAGCYGWAQHEMEADNPRTSDEHKPVMDAINEFYTNMASAPELADIDAEWAACMDDAGYPGFTVQADAQNSISEELNAFYENQTEWVEDDPELAKLGEKEIELALADLDCREKTDFRAEYTKITFALEEQFIEDNKAELDALKAAAEQAR